MTNRDMQIQTMQSQQQTSRYNKGTKQESTELNQADITQPIAQVAVETIKAVVQAWPQPQVKVALQLEVSQEA